MSDLEFIIRSTAVVALSTFLAIRFWRGRTRGPRGAWQWNGVVFDSTAFRPRLDALRRDYAAAAAKRRPHRKLEALVRGAREELLERSFFRTNSRPDLHRAEMDSH